MQRFNYELSESYHTTDSRKTKKTAHEEKTYNARFCKSSAEPFVIRSAVGPHRSGLSFDVANIVYLQT